MKEEFSFVVIPELHLGYSDFCLYDKIINWWNTWRTGKNEGVVAEGIEKRLIAAVRLINSLPEIELVGTLGDFSQEGRLPQLLRAKEILDELKVPLIPVLGNHDLMPYADTPGWDSFIPRLGRSGIDWGKRSIGIENFEEVFKDNFQQLSNFCQDWEKPKPQEGETRELRENYAFTYKSTRFIVVDNVKRRRNPYSKRTQQIFLHPESKKWLQKQLSKKEKGKIIFSHSPLNPWPWLLRRLFGKTKVVNISGHWHKEISYPPKLMTTFVTDALYQKPVIIVVKVLPDEIQFQTVRIP